MHFARIIPAALVVLLAATAWAHGGGEHLMGTVKAIDATSITVETKDGHSAIASIDDATKFEKDSQPAKRDDVKVGERVVVHTSKAGDGLRAILVRIGKH